MKIQKIKKIGIYNVMVDLEGAGDAFERVRLVGLKFSLCESGLLLFCKDYFGNFHSNYHSMHLV